MADYRLSYWKTTIASAAAALAGFTVVSAALILVWIQPEASSWTVRFSLAALILLLTVFSTWSALLALGGLTALRRDRLEAQGKPYFQVQRRESITGPLRSLALLWRRWTLKEDRHTRLGLMPGELIEIKSLEEILRTLDEKGTVRGIPFMPEMAPHCGARARVFRRVDKLNDWIHGTGLKRMHGLVLLEGLRCNGAGHGGCQAGCHLRWCDAWLRRVASERISDPALDGSRRPLSPSDPHPGLDKLIALARRNDADGDTRWVCQATELTAEGASLAWRDPRHYMRDLLTGNVRIKPFLVGVSLMCFNWIQQRRSGVGFPVYSVGKSQASPHAELNLILGEFVRVKPKRLIEMTLNQRSRNRGLWFDREMLRFCGGIFRVKSRVERVVVEKTGELRDLSNPCIVLDGVTATGEYAGFNPENENIFWREIWLERVAPPASVTSPTETESGWGTR
jgi:hypothetical protein